MLQMRVQGVLLEESPRRLSPRTSAVKRPKQRDEFQERAESVLRPRRLRPDGKME